MLNKNKLIELLVNKTIVFFDVLTLLIIIIKIVTNSEINFKKIKL